MRKKLDYFRSLIVLAVLFSLAGYFVSWNIQDFVPKEQAHLYGWYGHGAIISNRTADVFTYLYLAAYFIGLAGMFFFYSSARWLFMLSYPIALLLIIFTGTYVYSPIESAVWFLANFFTIFIVGMAFFCRPIVVKFRQSDSDLTNFSRGMRHK